MNTNTKKCSRCGEEKDFSLFSKSKSMKFGLDSWCKECRAEDRRINRYDEIWSKNNPDKRKQIDKRNRQKLRMDALMRYSDGEVKCACCGEKRVEFLAIDHINGNGAEHRREIKWAGGKTIFQWLRNNNYPDGFRVLCHNCNMSRGCYGYCPHEEEKHE